MLGQQTARARAAYRCLLELDVNRTGRGVRASQLVLFILRTARLPVRGRLIAMGGKYPPSGHLSGSSTDVACLNSLLFITMDMPSAQSQLDISRHKGA